MEVGIPNLRELKKAHTRDLLAQAAYEVIREHGVQALSADAITQRAGVSRRTFFNYFPTVESSIVPIVEEFLVDVSARVDADAIGESLMGSLAQVLRELDDMELLERFTVIGLMAHRSAHHKSLLHEATSEWLTGFVEQLGELVEGADELWLHGAATGLVSAAEAACAVWITRTDGEITPTTLALHQELLAEAIDRLGTGFDH